MEDARRMSRILYFSPSKTGSKTAKQLHIADIEKLYYH